jgi:ATP-binding cassette subfamily B (MDR/TAP) protein 1
MEIGKKGIDNDASDAMSVGTEGSKKKTPKVKQDIASIGETLSFVFDCGIRTKILFAVGVIGGIGNGVVYPFIAFIFSRLFSELILVGSNGIGPLATVVYWMIGIGFWALVMGTLQTMCFEAVAFAAAENLRLQWFKALLRQDQAFFDVYDVGGIANAVNPAANRYKRGVGRKFGELFEFSTMSFFGFVFALQQEWRVTLVILSVLPAIVFFSLEVIKANQTKTSSASKIYSKAGSVAYSTVSGIKTVLSLNAAPSMIEKYKTATLEAYLSATKLLLRQGFANGGMLGSFIFMYIVLALYGVHVIYQDVMETGCDPSGAAPVNPECTSSGGRVFAAMLGVAFAGQGVSSAGNILEIFQDARAAAGQALTAINRKPGQPEKKIYDIDDEKDEGDDSESLSGSRHSGSSFMIESPEGRIKAILPAYEIDAMSNEGLKPEKVEGELTFEDVEFSYPTRPGQSVLQGLSIDIPAGKTIAFVGPSGGGKSTVVKLLERFYDPTAGSLKLDGVNIREINVKHLRSMIGYVGQEPTLFATTIGKNIAFGLPGCSQEQIEEAAKQANAHDFITELPDGYDTDVGDKGSQLSGGQKQRIAIARVLISDPKILLLDEATSALDSQSELVVQEALEKIISTRKRTTVIIAHRLSTIRNADTIAVVMGGTIVEKGKHDKLMKEESYYKKLVESQGKTSMPTRKSSIMQVNADGTTESQRGFEKVPDEFVDMNGAPLIVFRNVNFTYPTRPDKMILDRFKMKIYKGETIGLCGISGGGKSTVMGLLERFYDPDEGSIEYHGEDLKELNVKWYRDQIGYVGQEPVLFEATIAENIAYGAPGVTREEIIEAAKQANAYDFIMKFPQDFDTPLSGGAGTELSGGQKQRVAIARALVKQPLVLLLDEATSALDNESERIVQDALNRLMESRDRTCIVIAHRLSTIRNADRIAFIGDGRVKEIGSHDELMEKANGKYKRLVQMQGRTASTLVNGFDVSGSKKNKTEKKKGNDTDEDDTEDKSEETIDQEETYKFDAARARKLASPDTWYFIVGSLGALMAGSVFPAWGLMFGETIIALYTPIFSCTPELQLVLNLTSCDDYAENIAEEMKQDSYILSVYWAIIIAVCIIGNLLLFWGFGTASERMNRRVRDSAFTSLVRQEVSYFDKRSVGKITSELEEDAAQIQTFTGDPIRKFLLALSSVLTGLVLAFYFMWPTALVTIGCLPFMAWAQSLEMEKTMGTDDDVDKDDEKLDVNTPGGIAVETLLNMGTVSALTMQDDRYETYEEALSNSDKDWIRTAARAGVLAGLSMGIQQWIYAVLFAVGGALLKRYPDSFAVGDFNNALFCVMFGLFGLAAAFQDVADRKQMEKSAKRIFHLMDRQSEIDPLSDEGKTVDYSVPMKSKKSKSKKSLVKNKRESSLKNVAEEEPEVTGEAEEDVKPRSSSSNKKKSNHSSKKLLDESDGDKEKPKSSKKKKKKAKKKDSTDGESEDIMFVPPGEDDSEEPPADVSDTVASLE